MAKVPPIVPVSDLSRAARVLKGLKKSSKPLFITQRGRATAVLMSLDAYERSEAEREPPAHAGQGREGDRGRGCDTPSTRCWPKPTRCWRKVDRGSSGELVRPGLANSGVGIPSVSFDAFPGWKDSRILRRGRV